MANADYRDELRLSKTISPDQAGERYRKLRNTPRYLLGALEWPRAGGEGCASGIALAGALAAASFVRIGRNGAGEVRDLRRSPARGALPAIVRNSLQRRSFRIRRLSAKTASIATAPTRCAVARAARALSEVSDRLTACVRAVHAVHNGRGVADAEFGMPCRCTYASFRKRRRIGKSRPSASRWSACAAVRAGGVTGALEARAPRTAHRRCAENPRRRSTSPIRSLLGPAKSADLAELCITSGITIEAGEGPSGAFTLTGSAWRLGRSSKSPGEEMRALLERLARSRATIRVILNSVCATR